MFLRIKRFEQKAEKKAAAESKAAGYLGLVEVSTPMASAKEAVYVFSLLYIDVLPPGHPQHILLGNNKLAKQSRQAMVGQIRS